MLIRDVKIGERVLVPISDNRGLTYYPSASDKRISTTVIGKVGSSFVLGWKEGEEVPDSCCSIDRTRDFPDTHLDYKIIYYVAGHYSCEAISEEKKSTMNICQLEVGSRITVYLEKPNSRELSKKETAYPIPATVIGAGAIGWKEGQEHGDIGWVSNDYSGYTHGWYTSADDAYNLSSSKETVKTIAALTRAKCFELGQKLEKEGNLSEAKEAYKQAAQSVNRIDAEYSEYQFALGHLLYQLGMFDDAHIHLYNAYLHIEDKKIKAYYLYSWMKNYSQQSITDIDSIKIYLKQVIELDIKYANDVFVRKYLPGHVINKVKSLAAKQNKRQKPITMQAAKSPMPLFLAVLGAAGLSAAISKNRTVKNDLQSTTESH